MKYLGSIIDNKDLVNKEYVDNLIAPTYTSTSAYSVGQGVIYNNKLYKCNTAIPSPGEGWTSAHWTEVKMANTMDDITNIRSTLDEAVFALIIRNGSVMNTGNGNQVATANIIPWGKYNSIRVIINKSLVNPTDFYRITVTTFSITSGKPEDNATARITQDVTVRADGNIVIIYRDMFDTTSVGFAFSVSERTENDVAVPIRKGNFSASGLLLAFDIADLSRVEADISTLEEARNFPYPFTATSTLIRPNYPDQIVYSESLNGIKDLVVYANDSNPYYVDVLYAYHNTEHYSCIGISNGTRRGHYKATRSSATDLPTETVTIRDTNGILLATATIDWSKINTANGVNLNLASTCIQEGCIERLNGIVRFLPISDLYITNIQQRIYFDEICEGFSDGYFFVSVSGATYPEVTYSDRYVQFNVTNTKNINVTISFRRQEVILASTTITVHCNISTIPSKKYMFIGDSYTNAGYMQNWFYDNNPGLVTLYGTMGTAPYLHEGRNGWSVYDYFNASKDGIINPFYNPISQTFDFSYYITNNPSFADVDVVNILLGRNDGFALTIKNRMQQIIDSIKAYNSDIEVFVMVGSNVAADNSGAGKYLQNSYEFNQACFQYNAEISYTDATLIYQGTNLDDVYDFTRQEVQATYNNPATIMVYTDNVHPSQYGYEAFGIVFNGYMHNLLNS